VVKVYVSGDVAYLPQYRLPFFKALLKWQFGWMYFIRPHLKSNDGTKVSFSKLEPAISYCKDRRTAEVDTNVVWDSKHAAKLDE